MNAVEKDCDLDKAIATTVIFWILSVVIFAWWMLSFLLALFIGFFICSVLLTINAYFTHKEQMKEKE